MKLEPSTQSQDKEPLAEPDCSQTLVDVAESKLEIKPAVPGDIKPAITPEPAVEKGKPKKSRSAEVTSFTTCVGMGKKMEAMYKRAEMIHTAGDPANEKGDPDWAFAWGDISRGMPAVLKFKDLVETHRTKFEIGSITQLQVSHGAGLSEFV